MNGAIYKSGIIGFCGPMGCGKSTAVDYILKYVLPYNPCFKLSFTDGLYCAVSLLYTDNWDKKTIQENKNTLHSSGRTYREILQLFGAEIGRLIDKDTWINLYGKGVHSRCVASGDCYIVTDDVRFENEVDCIHNRGGVVIKLTGHEETVYTGVDNHASEMELLIRPDLYDYTFDNTGMTEDEFGVELIKFLKDKDVIESVE